MNKQKKCPHCGKPLHDEGDGGEAALIGALFLVGGFIAYGVWFAWQAGVFG